MKNGVLLIDKPAGMSSHHVVSKLRKKLGTKKIGHAGTLDPSATGLLVLCIEHATKISSFLCESDKIYTAEIILGKTTSTYDDEGEITSTISAEHVTEEQTASALNSFLGIQKQVPPMYSAIKVAGKKLYEYARAERQVDVPEREIQVFEADLLQFQNPEAKIQIHCSKGTYIRSIVHDLGQKLGVGAYVKVIRRIKSGAFHIDQSMPLDELLAKEVSEIENRMLSIETALNGKFHTHMVSKDDEERLQHGIEYPKIQFKEQNFDSNSLFLFVSSETKKELAIGEWGNKDRVSIKRVFSY